jgi:hypothetical protein
VAAIAEVGVPEITQVVEFKVTPAGNAGVALASAQRVTGVPVLVSSVGEMLMGLPKVPEVPVCPEMPVFLPVLCRYFSCNLTISLKIV